MRQDRLRFIVVAALTLASGARPAFAQSADPLPSWNDGRTKQAILDFVAKVTTPGAADFVPPGERIATFDNDGTLWVEQPLYFQIEFGIARIQELGPSHPEWQTTEPFKSVLAGDVKTAFAGEQKALIDILAAASSGMTTEEFDRIVKTWITTAKHPKTGRLYAEMVYQPMLETAGLSSRERVQDLHRVRRRRRFHARLRGAGLRRPARTGDRQHRQAAVRPARREACARQAASS